MSSTKLCYKKKDVGARTTDASFIHCRSTGSDGTAAAAPLSSLLKIVDYYIAVVP